MATSFSANQYENAFNPKRLANYELPHPYRERPRTYTGITEIIATDRGHLLGHVPRSGKNPWGNYTGTWDMPNKLPGPKYSLPTTRALHSQKKLHAEADKAHIVLSGQTKNDHRRRLKERRIPDFSMADQVFTDEMAIDATIPERTQPTYKYPKTRYPNPNDYVNLTPDSSPDGSQQAPLAEAPHLTPRRTPLLGHCEDHTHVPRSASPPTRSPCRPESQVPTPDQQMAE
ncbi:Protein Flattop [Lamellibrachia satsuma]|nr:Protein Flattop [Lamellibrachia satsuma]